MSDSPDPVVPAELPVLPLREAVAFPLSVLPLTINRPVSIDAINRALTAGDRMVFLTLQSNRAEDPQPPDLHAIGTVGVIRQMARTPGGIQVVIEGIERARGAVVNRTGNTMSASIIALPEIADKTLEVDAYVRRIQEQVDKALSLTSGLSQELRGVVANLDNPLRLAYLLGSLLDMPVADKQALLEADPLIAKLEAVSAALAREIALLEVKGKIESQAQQEMSDAQRQYYLRQQLKAIQEELGEGEADEIKLLREKIAAARLPETAQQAADRELGRLARMNQASPDYQITRTYLEWLLEIPWSVTTDDRLDPVEARRVLDEDHYDLDKIKERIVEYLAVRKLKGDMKGPILCFVGPPGVGKTSLGHSIARAMNRKFVRISLGGVRDEAEVRGHRRTYIGALPGRIVNAIKQAGAMNPVFMLDEMDKLATGFQGDPAAALLEVLDPAQNHSFRDHYLEVPLDLSHVLFIATANQLGTLHPALLDRVEVVSLSGYTEDEKRHIARRFLIPRQVQEHGLPDGVLEITDTALGVVITQYTREAGVRSLERMIGAIARKVAARLASRPAEETGPPPTTRVDAEQVPRYLGQPRFQPESPFRTSRPGVATGVAWTETGGDVLFIEATLMPGGSQQIILTGQLGSVMQESARAAVSHIRSSSHELGIAPDFFEHRDLHVHVPAGAIPKDGPSAGVTMATAILSAIRKIPIRSDVAMTGEITLSGLVLPVGGIREKALAARRMGIKTFVLPARNAADLEELPADLKKDMRFVLAATLEDVLREALPANAPALATELAD
ncbi:MAG: endopeptidase La [Vicinamibacteria bacterium]|nr:endopeptidase La [Vicinamibacteria bacterium]